MERLQRVWLQERNCCLFIAFKSLGEACMSLTFHKNSSFSSFFIGLPPTRYPLTSTDCVRCFPRVDFSCVWANRGVFLCMRGWNWFYHFWKRFGCVGVTILLWDQLPSFAQCWWRVWRFCLRSFGCKFVLTDGKVVYMLVQANLAMVWRAPTVLLLRSSCSHIGV